MAERNISFNEAKTMGLVAPNAVAEQEVLKLAGGESALRPESWWNQQLTNQINAKNFQTLLGFREDSLTGLGRPLIQGPPGQTTAFTINVPSETWGNISQTQKRYVPVYQDVTIDVLKAITAQSKKSVQELQRETGEAGASRKRLARVTGGLLAGTQAPSMGAVSSGPMLGSEEGLGTSSTLGRRTRI